MDSGGERIPNRSDPIRGYPVDPNSMSGMLSEKQSEALSRWISSPIREFVLLEGWRSSSTAGAMESPSSSARGGAAKVVAGGGGIRWADTPEDVVEEIIKKIGPTADLPRFASACKSWHSVASRIGSPRWRKLPWLLLANKVHDSPAQTFYSPSDMTFHEVLVPRKSRCICSANGWLVMVRDLDLPVPVLNPITRRQVMLPPPWSVEGMHGAWKAEAGFFHKVCLSCCPLSHECVTLAFYGIQRKLAIANPGDGAWTAVRTEEQAPRPGPFENAVYHKGQFYAVTSHGEIWRIDPATREAVLFAPCPHVVNNRYFRWSSMYSWSHAHYLVESSGDLLYVFRSRRNVGAEDKDGDPLRPTSAFSVLKVRVQDGAVVWEKVTSLGDRSLFLGFAMSKSVIASEISDCRRNCIYFTDDTLYHCRGRGATGHDMGFYDLGDDRVYRYKPYVDIFGDQNISSPSSLVLPDSSSPWAPPLWFFPSLE